MSNVLQIMTNLWLLKLKLLRKLKGFTVAKSSLWVDLLTPARLGSPSSPDLMMRELTCRCFVTKQSAQKAAPFLSSFKRSGRSAGVVDFVASGSRFKVSTSAFSSIHLDLNQQYRHCDIRFSCRNKTSNSLSSFREFEHQELLETLQKRVNLLELRLRNSLLENSFREMLSFWLSRRINLEDLLEESVFFYVQAYLCWGLTLGPRDTVVCQQRRCGIAASEGGTCKSRRVHDRT